MALRHWISPVKLPDLKSLENSLNVTCPRNRFYSSSDYVSFELCLLSKQTADTFFQKAILLTLLLSVSWAVRFRNLYETAFNFQKRNQIDLSQKRQSFQSQSIHHNRREYWTFSKFKSGKLPENMIWCQAYVS